MLKISAWFRPVYAFALFCVCWLGPRLNAQSTDADLKSRLTGKPLYLKAFWRDDKLHFDPNGQLIGASAPVPFTVAGFDLKRVQLKRDKLILEGRRIGLELVGDQPMRVALQVGKPDRREDESMHIEIDANPSGDYGRALDAIFVDGLADLAPLLPSYWQRYARKVFLPAAASEADQSISPQDHKPKRIGGAVKAPRLLHSADPQFSAAARLMKYSGAVLVNCRVEAEGTVSHLTLLRPVGLGLDEQALAAVQQYSFQPAMEDGKPVVVELNVEVNFQIF